MSFGLTLPANFQPPGSLTKVKPVGLSTNTSKFFAGVAATVWLVSGAVCAKTPDDATTIVVVIKVRSTSFILISISMRKVHVDDDTARSSQQHTNYVLIDTKY
jgi:hypothetical protein